MDVPILTWLIDILRHGFTWSVDVLVAGIQGFDNKEIAFVVAYAILIFVGLFWAWISWGHHRPFIRTLKSLTRKINAVAKDEKLAAPDRLAEVEKAFKRKPMLKPVWLHYRANMREINGEYNNLVDPRAWFSVDALPGRGYEKWCSTLAGVFLTVGLLFTFIGLSAALLKVDLAEISSGGIESMQGAIRGILEVSSAKFITSIAGLIAYIIWSLIGRRYQSQQSKAAARLTAAVQKLSVYKAPETLLYEQLETNRKQLDRLDHFTDDLAVALDTKIGDRLASLSTTFESKMGDITSNLPAATSQPIVESIKDLRQHIGQTNEEGLKKILEEFLAGLQGGTGDKMGTVAEKLSAVADKLSEVKDGIGNSGQTFGAELGKAATELVNASKSISAAFGNRSSELEERIKQFDEKLGAITGQFDRLGKTIPEDIQAALAQVLEQLKESVNLLVAQLAAGGERSGQALEDATKRAGEQFDEKLRGASQHLSETLSGSTSNLSQVIGTLIERLKQLESSLQALPTSVDQQIERLDRAGETLDGAGQTISTTAGSLRDAASTVDDLTRTVRSALTEIRASVEKSAQADTSIQETLARLQAATKEANEFFEQHEARFGQLDDQLGKTLDSLRDGVVQIGEATGKAFAEYEQHMASALGSLASAIEDFAEELFQNTDEE